ncbi:MAG: hypothetical protein WBM13_10160 [Bacteroidia bacterium]
MKKKITIGLLIWASYSYAQNVGINSTGASPDASAMLDVDAAPTNDKGVLLPRVALLATNNPLPVTNPATSLVVYNTAIAGIAPNNVVPGFYYWDGSVWKTLGANSSDLDIVELVYDLPSGSNGGASVANTWTTREINTELTDFNNLCTLSSNQFTLAAGTYDIQFNQIFFSEGNVPMQFHSRLKNITSNTTALIALTGRLHANTGSSGNVDCEGRGVVQIATPTTFELQYFAENAWNRGLGYGLTGASGENERYVYIRIKRIAQ